MTKHSRGRLRVFFAEFDGDDATIQEGLRAISVAVNKTFQPRTVIKHLPADQISQISGDTVVDESLEELPDDEAIDVQSNPAPKRKRRPPAMSIVKNLDLHPSGKKHLREFYEEKKPKTQTEQVATFVYYLSHVLEVAGVTANHIFTCFKDVNVRAPNDLPQIIRNTAGNKHGWVDCSNASDIKITNPGENLVEHDLPRNGD